MKVQRRIELIIFILEFSYYIHPKEEYLSF